jgi:hypothetical protein
MSLRAIALIAINASMSARPALTSATDRSSVVFSAAYALMRATL